MFYEQNLLNSQMNLNPNHLSIPTRSQRRICFSNLYCSQMYLNQQVRGSTFSLSHWQQDWQTMYTGLSSCHRKGTGRECLSLADGSIYLIANTFTNWVRGQHDPVPVVVQCFLSQIRSRHILTSLLRETGLKMISVWDERKIRLLNSSADWFPKAKWSETWWQMHNMATMGYVATFW